MNDLIPIATVELVRFLSAKLPDLSPDWWRKHVVDRLTFQQQRIVEERNHDKLQQLDLAALLRVLDHNWFELSNTLKLPREGRNWVKELQTVRNRWAHISSEDVSSSDVYRDADTLGRLLTIIEAQQSSLDAVEAAKKFALASMSRNENDQANKVTELETPVSGQRSIIGTFQAGNGPDWPTYVALLKERDDEWKRVRVGGTQIRVFGPQPSWQDTIARGQFIFDEDNWDTLDDDQCAMIAPTHEFLTGNALLGSIGRRSTDVRDFLFNPERAKDRNHVLDHLRWVRNASGGQIVANAGNILSELCSVRGMGKAFATRLLGLARPDCFVVVNNKSKTWLELTTGFGLSGNKRSYQNLISWVANQAWHSAPEPEDPWERSIWEIRAVLLDTFAYHPDDK